MQDSTGGVTVKAALADLDETRDIGEEILGKLETLRVRLLETRNE